MTRHLLKPREAAEQLRLTEGQVRDLIREGRLASIRVGKRSYVPSDAPDRFLSEANACHDETLAHDSNGIQSGAMEPTTSHVSEAGRSRERSTGTILEAAEQLRVSRTWLDGFLKDKPYCYRKAGNRKRFTAADIALISEKMRCHSTSKSRARNAARTTASGERTSGSALNEALELARGRSPKRSSTGSSQKSNVVAMPSRARPPSRPQPETT
jgi:excisionase family DNA binding protein